MATPAFYPYRQRLREQEQEARAAARDTALYDATKRELRDMLREAVENTAAMQSQNVSQ